MVQELLVEVELELGRLEAQQEAESQRLVAARDRLIDLDVSVQEALQLKRDLEKWLRSHPPELEPYPPKSMELPPFPPEPRPDFLGPAG